MRTIKFRGKRTDTGEWICGDLLTSNGTECEISDWNDIVYSRYDVDPETIGQFTGLLDKNGKEIYEGDILRVTDDNIEESWKSEVEQKGIIEVNGCDYDYTLIEWADDNLTFEVIGNIHDNPELLKGGKE